MQPDYLKGLVQKTQKKGVYSILASTASIDRQGDSIDQAGWDLKNFKTNPVLIWAHDYSLLPIGKVTRIEVVKGNLEADFEFASKEANPMAAQIEKLYEDGIVNASSVGFIMKERNGHVITKAELLELSLVPVPANQDALRLAFKSKSFNLIEKDFEKDFEKDAISEETVLNNIYETNFISDIANGNEKETDTEKGIIEKETEDTCAKLFISDILAKSGKRLSKKTLSVIDNAILSMQESIKVLENLLKEDDQANDSEIEETQLEVEKSNKEETIEIPLSDFLKGIQSQIRISDKSNESALGIINNFLDRKSK